MAAKSGFRVNINQVERILSTVIGVILFKRNIKRLSLAGMLAGGAMIRRGLTGHCNLYESLKVTSVSAPKTTRKRRAIGAHA